MSSRLRRSTEIDAAKRIETSSNSESAILQVSGFISATLRRFFQLAPHRTRPTALASAQWYVLG